jgi:uncharacterized protein YceH (UPF0502 family)
VRDISPAPGSRAGRVTELLSSRGRSSADAPAAPRASESSRVPESPPAPAASAAPSAVEERVRELEARVERLERGLGTLADKLGETLEN